MATYMGLESNKTYYKYGQSYNTMTYAQAIEARNAALTNISRQSAHVNQMIDFIGKVALNEQKKEIDSIKNYCEKTGRDFPFLKDILQPDYIKNNPDKFQSEFIIAFDSARQDLENTKATIERLYKNAGYLDEKDIKTLNQYKHSEYLYTLAENLMAFAQQLTATEVNKAIRPNSIRQKINATVMHALKDMGIVDKIKSGVELVGFGAAMAIELNERVQKELDNDPTISTFEELNPKIINGVCNKFLDEIKSNSPTTELSALILNRSNDPQFNLAMKSIKEILHLREEEKDVTEASDKLINYLQKMDQERKNNVESAFIDLQKDITANPELHESLLKIHFSVSGNSGNKHGNINELVKSMLKGVNVRENVATDLITYHFDYDIEQDSQKIATYMDRMSESLSSIGSYLAKHKQDNNIEEFTRTLHRANKSLEHISQAIEDELKKFEKFNDKKMFIQHESLKLSMQAETGESKGFHGRNIKLTTYLGYLSSMSLAMTKDSGLSIDIPELEFLAYNILPGAVGDDHGRTQTALQNYLSIYAGMMMFDDVENMAKEAINQVQSLTTSGSVETLHIYNINGIMAPASTVLTRMYDALSGTKSLFNTGTAVQATISTGKGRDINDVRISITFMSDFIQMIESLYKAIE